MTLRRTRLGWRGLAAAALAIGALAGAHSEARADGIWSSLRQAAGLESKARKTELTVLDAFIRSRPESPRTQVELAAHAGAEGHWTFLNRRGDTFTVGTPDEMRRVVAALAPDADPKSVLTVHLSAETVFERAMLLKELPVGSRLSLVSGADTFPLIRARDSGKLIAAVRSRLQIEIGRERGLFEEAIRQIARPLEPRLVRIVSLEPKGPETLPRWPAIDPASRRPPLAAIDPYKLPAALSTLRGQTAVISGRIAGQYLTFRPPSGSEATILAADVVQAAARSNVDLVLVQSPTPHQPGGRNWLWQRFAIDGLDKALGHATVADFLETLAGGRGAVLIKTSSPGGERIALDIAVPEGALGSGIGGVLHEVTAGITGNISPTTILAHLTTTAHRRELSLRVVPMVPSSWQAMYGAALLLGLLGMPAARRWWSRIWPAENRAEYGGVGGYWAARVSRLAAFALVFVPVIGPVAVAATVLEMLKSLIRRAARDANPGTPQAG